ncbi:MAG: radical SAM protein [Candidatus Lokiarchaeota archaeon]|nr:radical SAM protein [Candidatus Lokiarchaeota archaeon]
MPREYTYGPFPSRRLGLSLGVDVLPKIKTCTFNCVYCEIGNTTHLVSPKFRINSPPSTKFEKELREILKYFPHLGSITFGYNGEPTLNENLMDFYDIALKVRNELNWKGKPPLITLFTNSSTLHFEDIQDRIMNFEVVLAKLDVATPADYARTNRPHQQCPDIGKIIDSLIQLRKKMNNKLVLQCLMLNSHQKDVYIPNFNEKNIEKLAFAIKKIKPNEVQIYSLARVPAEYFVFSIDENQNNQIKKVFNRIIDNKNIEISYF